MVHKFSATNYHISQTFGSPHTPSTFLGIETAAFYFSTMHTMANLGHVRCLYSSVVCLPASPHVCCTLAAKQRLGNDETPMLPEFIKTASLWIWWNATRVWNKSETSPEQVTFILFMGSTTSWRRVNWISCTLQYFTWPVASTRQWTIMWIMCADRHFIANDYVKFGFRSAL